MKSMVTFIIICILVISTKVYAENTENTAEFTLPSGVDVKVVEGKFVKKLFKVAGCTVDGDVCLINNRIPFGVSFGLPKTYVKSISVSYKGKLHFLDVREMYNAWGTRPLQVKGTIRYFGGKCSDSTNCEFRGVFSDASGTYVAEWRIVEGRQIRTVLTDSKDVVELFSTP